MHHSWLPYTNDISLSESRNIWSVIVMAAEINAASKRVYFYKKKHDLMFSSSCDYDNFRQTKLRVPMLEDNAC